MSQSVISIKKIDEVNLHIDCERSIAYDLIDFFSFYVPGYRFMKKYKERLWDGRIRLFNTRGTLYVGLLYHLAYFCKKNGHHLEFDPSEIFRREDRDEVIAYIRNLIVCDDYGEPLTVRDYQETAVAECLDRGRRTIVSSTSSGKSLMIYLLCHYLIHVKGIEKKILIVAPTTTLVRQMRGDFRNYSAQDPWNTDADLHEIMSGAEKNNEDAKIYVSTWQSIYKLPRQYFQQFDCIIGDEVHEFDAQSVKGILEKANTTFYRFGFTGTLKEGKAHKLVVEGLFGPSVQIMTAEESIRRGESAKTFIHMTVLRWSKEQQDQIKGARYHDEMEWLRTHNRRNLYIAGHTLHRKMSENSLILVNNIDHGKMLEDYLRKGDKKNRQIFFVHGDTSVDSRDAIRTMIDKQKPGQPGVIVIATYGTFQRGINIKRLHNLYFAAPSKSLVRVLQSLGRGLRKSGDKSVLHLYDFVDDLSGKRKKKNYSWQHGHKRLSIYEDEGYPVDTEEVAL